MKRLLLALISSTLFTPLAFSMQREALFEERRLFIEARRPLTLELIEAVKNGKRDEARRLIRNGALIGDDDKLPNSCFGGLTSFDWAAVRGDGRMMNLLLDELDANTPPQSPFTGDGRSLHPDSNYRILRDEIKANRRKLIPLLTRIGLKSSSAEERRLEQIRQFLVSEREFFDRALNTSFLLGQVLNQAEIELIRVKLYASAQLRGNREMAEALIATGPISIDSPDAYHLVRMLNKAVERRDYRLMKALIAWPVDVYTRAAGPYNMAAQDNRLPLGVALARDDVMAVNLLIAAGFDVEAEDNDGIERPLHTACRHGMSCVQSLLEAGAKNCKERLGHHRWATDYLNDTGMKLYFDALVKASVKRYAPTKQQVKRALVNIWPRIEMFSFLPPYVLLEILSYTHAEDLLTLSLFTLQNSDPFAGLRELLQVLPRRKDWETHKITKAFDHVLVLTLLQTRPRAVKHLLMSAKKEASSEATNASFLRLFPEADSFENSYKALFNTTSGLTWRCETTE